MKVFEDRIQMGPEEFRLIRNLVYDYCGIFFDDDVKFILERRLSPRVKARTLGSFSEYYRFLRYNSKRAQELEEIVELLTTNETYFFREEYQLRAFGDEILPEMAHKLDEKKIRIWSAGCSTGEEAYSIAIVILEKKEFADWDIEIFASDISKKVVQVARKGFYGNSSFRVINHYLKQKYFTQMEKGYQIDPKAKSLVSFGQLNLLDQDMMQLIQKVDVIFCRNVLIYFDKPAKLRVVKMFYDKLKPGGYLLLGNSESLMSVSTDFELVHLKNDLVYRKPVISDQKD